MIAIGADHGGYKLKEEIKSKEQNTKTMELIMKKEQTIQYMQKRLQSQYKIKNVILEYQYADQDME